MRSERSLEVLSRRKLLAGLAGAAIADTLEASEPLSKGVGDAELFLFLGQSNMSAVGTVDSSTLPAHLIASDRNIYIWNDGTLKFQVLVNGTNNNQFNKQWGPEAEFSYQWRLANPSKTFFMYKLGYDGSFLAQGESPADWNPASKGKIFDTVTGKIPALRSGMSMIGPSISHIHVLWMQGESDATDTKAANAYAANLATFFTQTRIRWGDARTKIIVGRIRTTAGSFASTVRAAQQLTVSGDSNSALVDTDFYPLARDRLHYTPMGIIRLGGDMYSAYLALR